MRLMLTGHGPRGGRARPSMAGSKHGAPFIDTCIHNKEIVILWEHVFVRKMHASFLRGGADLVAVYDETSVLRALFSSCGILCVDSQDLRFSHPLLSEPHLADHGSPQYAIPRNIRSGNSCDILNSGLHDLLHNEFRTLQRWKMSRFRGGAEGSISLQ